MMTHHFYAPWVISAHQSWKKSEALDLQDMYDHFLVKKNSMNLGAQWLSLFVYIILVWPFWQ